jgi:CDP-diacylglycerol--serine O-phosphatidyltransferase
MNDRLRKDKLVFFLPNSFTALNIACGFVAILLSMQGEFYKSCMLIALGAIFDSVDGRVARLTGSQSAFGEQFDSLSDLISFGIAPSIIFYNKFLAESGRVGIVVAFLFLLCGALRLARFNANIDKVKSDYFQGLPIPGAAAAIVGYILLSIDFPEYLDHKFISIPYLIFYAFLMISNIPFPSFKNSEWVRKNKKKVLFIMVVLVSCLFIHEELMIGLIITFYVLASLVYRLTHKDRFANIFDWDEDAEDEKA